VISDLGLGNGVEDLAGADHRVAFVQPCELIEHDRAWHREAGAVRFIKYSSVPVAAVVKRVVQQVEDRAAILEEGQEHHRTVDCARAMGLVAMPASRLPRDVEAANLVQGTHPCIELAEVTGSGICGAARQNELPGRYARSIG
jgi:hypothetical protein